MPRIQVSLDENVPASLSDSLTQRQIAVTTAQREQTQGFSDDEQLRYAASKGFVLLTTNVRHFHRWHHEFRANGWGARRHHHRPAGRSPPTATPHPERDALSLDGFAGSPVPGRYAERIR